jgi:acetolactate synthase, large subunit (EC 2.2.1.6)
MKMTGAKIFVESLKKEGVDTIFGYPGGVVLNIYDELYRSDIRHILVRHEQGAAHMADGYARASGKVGVCLVTSGPGATNTVTGITTAYMDSIPIIVFTGQVPTNLVGNDAFQEADTIGITRSCTKHNFLIKNVKDMARTIKEAFYIARTGRPGPVVVDIPKDVTIDSTEFHYPEHIDLPGYKPIYEGHTGQIKRAIDMILASKKPVIYTGGGIISSDAAKELLTFAELLKTPVTNTLMGLGGFPGEHPLFLGMLGMHGTYAANMAVTHTDMLIAIGARFDDRVTGDINEFAPEAKIVHIDIDPTSISKNVEVDVPIVGNAKSVLAEMNKLIKKDKRLKEFLKK